MACCLAAPSRYLNHCWLISDIQIFLGQFHKRYLSHQSLKISLKITFKFQISVKSPRGQWVNSIESSRNFALYDKMSVRDTVFHKMGITFPYVKSIYHGHSFIIDGQFLNLLHIKCWMQTVLSTLKALNFVHEFSNNVISITENDVLVCNFLTSFSQSKLVTDELVNLFKPHYLVSGPLPTSCYNTLELTH